MVTSKTIKGRKAYATGRRAEELACRHYEKLGFSILANRYKTKYGEIDCIARRDDLLVFIEVKARPTLNDGMIAVPVRSQKRIANAANFWIAENQSVIGSEFSCRFDVAIVLPDDLIEIVEGAFQTGP